MTNSHFDAIGGSFGVRAAVTELYERVSADPEVAPMFAGADMPNLRRHMVDIMTVVLGGPSRYHGRDLHEAHASLAITDAQFDRVRDHVLGTFGDLGVGPDLLDHMTSTLAGLRTAVVTRTISHSGPTRTDWTGPAAACGGQPAEDRARPPADTATDRIVPAGNRH